MQGLYRRGCHQVVQHSLIMDPSMAFHLLSSLADKHSWFVLKGHPCLKRYGRQVVCVLGAFLILRPFPKVFMIRIFLYFCLLVHLKL